ncbi:MAG: hypothetical protein HOV66_18715 [Streptomycetaceae bacterium]|nr:hypothetical protein [Streptomycetaceae bacterium]NUS56866.1 hypothetical protein [Streptomycetaceae bacterium]
MRRYRKLRLHRTFAIALFCLAVAIAVSHVLEHAGAFQLMSPGWQDLLLGYPTAGLLAIIGGMLLPANR